jgi:hypothetical protein
MVVPSSFLFAQDCTFQFESDTLTYCNSSLVELQGPEGFDSYQWVPGETAQSQTVGASGWYRITASSAECVLTDSVFVSVLNAQIDQVDTAICAGDSVVLSASAFFGVDDTPAPVGFTFFTEANGHLYFRSVQPRSWMDARDAAAAAGGHLITIASAAENNLAISAFPGQNQWIGYTDELVEGAWQWITGEPTSYTNWASDEPNNQNIEHYAEILTTGEWNDLNGVIEYPFLLEFDGPSNIEVYWSTGDTATSITVAPPVTTTYTATVSNGFHECVYSVTVTVETPQVIFAEDDVFQCGTTVTLDAGQGESYLWNTGESTQTIEVGEGSYSVVVDQGVCVASDQLELTTLDASIAEGNQQLCSGESVTLTASIAATTGTDFPGFTYQGEYDNSRYYYSTGVQNVNGARSSCEQIGGYLVSINNAQEAAFIDTFRGSTSIYIGFTDEQNEGSFAWMNGDPVTFTNWSPGEPNDVGGEDYTVVVTNGLWNDVSGVSANRFVCEVSNFNVVSFQWSNGSVEESITVQPTSNTWYTLTVTANSQVCSDSVLVEVFTPQFALPQDTLFACGNEATLDAGTGMISYQWSTGQSGQTIQVSESGLYSVVVDEGACISSDTLELFLLKANIVQENQSICLGESLELDLNPALSLPTSIPGYSYAGEFNNSAYFISSQSRSWTDASAQCGQIGGHLVTIGSAAENSFVQSVHPVMRQWIGFTDQVQEGNWQWVTGEEVVYTNWNSPSEPNNSGGVEHYAELMGSTGLWNDMPNGLILNPFICEFTASDDLVINWSTGETGESIVVSPLTDETFFVTVSDGLQTCTDSVQVSVFVPQFSFVTDSLFVCEASTVLDAGAGWNSVQWSTGGTGQTLNVTGSGQYTVIVDEGACVSQDTLNVFLLDPSILEGDQIICKGEGVTLTTSASGVEPEDIPNFTYAGEFQGSNYYTSNSPSTWTIAADNCAAQGGYLASIGSAAENSYLNTLLPGVTQWIGFTDQVTEGVFEWTSGEPVVYTNWNIGEPNNSSNEDYTQMLSSGVWNDSNPTAAYRYVCEFDNLPGLEIVWSTGETTASIVVTPDTTTTYFVVANNGVQVCSDSVVITVNEPQFAFENDTLQVCGSEAVLEANTGFAGYLWSTGASGTSTTVERSGLYSIIVDEGACTTTDSLFVSLVNPEIAQTDTAVCFGQEVYLSTVNSMVDQNTQFPGYTYSGQLNNSFYFISNGTSNFSMANQSCTDIGGHLVTISSVEEHNLVAGMSSSNIYIGLTDAASEGNFQWVTNEPLIYTNWGSGEPSNSGNNEDYVHIQTNNVWNDVSGVEQYFHVCEFSGSQNLTFTWFNGESNPELTFVPPSTSFYPVTVTDGVTVCTDSIFIEVNPLPQPFLGGDTLIVCEESSLVLDPSVELEVFEWSTNQSDPTVVVNQSGEYSVTVTDSLGCSNSDTTYVHFFVSPNVSVTDTTICIGQPLTIELDLIGETIVWPDNSGSGVFTFEPSADSLVVYTVFDGIATCSDSVIVRVSNVVLAITSTEPTCYGELNGDFNAAASGGIAPYTFDWNGFNPSQLGAGSYALVVTDSIGCSVDSVLVLNQPLPFMLFGVGIPPLCDGQEGSLVVQSVGGTQPHAFDDLGVDFSNALPGDYTVAATDANGCVTQQLITVPAASAVCGCTYPTACNFDPLATSDNGTCDYPVAGFDCEGNILCASPGIEGCTYPTACNYDPTAETDNGSCIYPEVGFDCNGVCMLDENFNGVCDFEELNGCTYSNAINYDANATLDNGTCTFGCPGDINNDGLINASDLSLFLSAFGTSCD